MAQDPSASRGDGAEPGAETTPEEHAGLPEPGAPISKDAVDPELVRLPPSRIRRSPLLAFAVLMLGALLLWRLRGDIAYSLQPRAPTSLGEARGAVSSMVPERYVSLSGMPDFRNALAFESRGERTRSQLFRLLGTQSRLLVVLGAHEEAEEAGLVGRFTGRLRRFSDLTYATTVKDYYRQKVQVTRALSLPALKALPDGPLPAPLSLADRAGESVTIPPEKELLIDVLFPEDLRVLLSRDKFPSEPDARHEVDRLGLPAGPGVETKDGFGYVLRLPAGAAARNQAVARVDAQGMLLWHRIEVYRVPLSGLRKGAGGLSIPGPDELKQPTRYEATGKGLVAIRPPAGEPVLLPFGDGIGITIQAVQISEPLNIPEGALVLVGGETPSGVRWTLPIGTLLLLFMGFNLWYLGRSFSEWREGA